MKNPIAFRHSFSMLAAAGLVSACGGLKTNPTEGYKDLGGVRPYAAVPDNRRPIVRLSQVFSVQFADANKQPLGDRPLAFEAGKAASYFVRSDVKLAGQSQPHVLAASGLPEGLAFGPVEGSPGLYQISGTPAPQATACGPQGASASKLAIAWQLAPNAPAEAQAAARSEIGESDRMVERAFALSQASKAPSISADERLASGLAAGEAFAIKVEGLATTPQFPPQLVLEGPGAASIEPAGAPRAMNAEGTSWEWSLRAKDGASAQELKFAAVVTNICDGQAARLDGLTVKIKAD